MLDCLVNICGCTDDQIIKCAYELAEQPIEWKVNQHVKFCLSHQFYWIYVWNHVWNRVLILVYITSPKPAMHMVHTTHTHLMPYTVSIYVVWFKYCTVNIKPFNLPTYQYSNYTESVFS